MARTTEPLAGGVVTSKDPALLAPGELSAARNCYYKPGTQALVRALGRSAFGTVTASSQSVIGLRDAHFDNDNHYLIGYANGVLKSAPVGATGTFTALASSTSGSSLESTHYRNRFYLFTGAPSNADAISSNAVVYLSATATATALSVRQHGMLPIATNLTGTTATGSWALAGVEATGYYEYWYTEVAKITQDTAEFTMEGTFSGTPWTVLVNSTATVPSIQLPYPPLNPITTSYRVYRSAKKDFIEEKRFPSGFMIGEVGVTATAGPTFADSGTPGSTGYIFPSSYNGVSNAATFYTDMGSNATALGADDGSVGSLGPVTTTTGTFGFPIQTIKRQGVFGFAVTGVSGPIKGIEVVAEGYISATGSGGGNSSTISVKLARGRQPDGSGILNTERVFGQSKFTPAAAEKFAVLTATAAGSPQTLTLGASAEPWRSDLPFVDTDFDANFMVILSNLSYNTVAFDYLKLKVYHGATTSSTTPFPTVVYTFGDITSQVGKNGPPPSATTGDVYQDTLVTNDINNAAHVRYSYPGDPDAFPSTYYVDFETSQNDRITLIKVINDRLIVGLERSIWRMNYLPSERDASFDRGKSKEAISTSYGVVDPMCACVFTPDGSKEMLAFVSHQGICGTDGYSFFTLTDSQNWRNIISLTSTSTPICLINDAERKILRFYFRNDSLGNETYMCLPLSYAYEHTRMEENKLILKAGGLIHMRNYDSGTGSYASLESAWSVPRSDGSYGTYLGYGGTTASATAAGAGAVYFETGSTIPANDPAFQYTTRRMYLAGLSNEWRLNELYGYVSSQTGTQTVSYTPLTIKTNDATGEVTQTAKTLSVGAATRPYKIPFNIGTEGLRLQFAVTSGHGDMAQEFLVIDGEDFGTEDSGK